MNILFYFVITYT